MNPWFALLALPWCQSTPATDVVFADFEGADYGPWTVAGEAFGRGPARGTLPGQMELGGIRIAWEAARGELVVAGHKVRLPLRDGRIALHVVTDRTAVEVFADDGLLYLPVTLPPAIPRRAALTGFAEGGAAQVALENSELAIIW